MKNLTCFSKALAAKMGWKMIKSSSLWSEVVNNKYTSLLHIEDWIKMPRWNRSNISMILRVFLNSFNYIRVELAWRVGYGERVHIGLDVWSRSGNVHVLPLDLIQFLEASGIRTLYQIVHPENFYIWSKMEICSGSSNTSLAASRLG